MISTGQKLYEAWAAAMLDEGVLVDLWDDLGDEDRAAWEAVGKQVAFV